MAVAHKDAIRAYWQEHPCDAQEVRDHPRGSVEFFEEIERQRYTNEDFIRRVVDFPGAAGMDVLEVGCGLGTDLAEFSRAGARVWGVDLTEQAVALSRQHLEAFGLPGTVLLADGELLPFPANSFDLVYSWGALHHTESPTTAAGELARVCRPGGRVLAMVYNRHSLFAVQAWLVFGLARGRLSSLSEVIGSHIESPGTRAYTRSEAKGLFAALPQVSVETVVTPFDLRVGRRAYLPKSLRRVVPRRLGWFLVVDGNKC